MKKQTPSNNKLLEQQQPPQYNIQQPPPNEQKQYAKTNKLAQINQNNGHAKGNVPSQIVDEAHVFGKDVDALLEEDGDASGDKKRPDIFAMFVATKKKATNIAGYSYMAPPPSVAPTIAMEGIASREDLPN